MKKIVFVLSIFMLIFFFAYNVYAIDTTKIDDSKEIQNFYNYIENIKDKYELLEDIDFKTYVEDLAKGRSGNISYKNILKKLGVYAFKEVAVSLRMVGVLIIISVICSLLDNLEKAFSNEKLSNIAYFACYSLLIIVIGKAFLVAVNTAKVSINQMSSFMEAIIPTLMMLLASTGGFTQASLLDPFIIGTIDLSTILYVNILIPLILMSFVLQFVNNISDDYKIDKLTKLINQVALWGQGVIMTIFVGIITIRGAISKSADDVASKTVKYAVDNFIPVVGSCLSDAVSTVAGYTLLLKNAVSVVGIIVLVAMLLFPIIKLFIMAILYKITAALIEPISTSTKLVNCINSAGDSIILITSCVISISVMFFIIIAIIIASGKMVGG